MNSFSFNDKISLRQLQALLIMDILGTGVIILPRKVTEFANEDGWIVIILATFVAMVYTYFLASIGRKFPNCTFLEYCGKILGKPLAVLISVGFIVKILLTIALELRFFAEIVKETMLIKTPFLVIYLALTCVSAYAAAKGYETRARISEVLLPIMFIPLLLVFLLASADVDFTNLLPVLKTDIRQIGYGSFHTVIAFSGIEFLLLVYPYIARPKNARKSAVSAIFLVGACMTLITLITIGKFSAMDLKRQMWPVIEMMDVIDFPGSFIERQDALMLSFWIVSVFLIINAGLFFASIQMKSIIKKGKHSAYIIVCVPIIIWVAYIPKNIQEVDMYMSLIFKTLGVFYMIVLPLLLLIVAKMRGLGEVYD